MENIFELKFSFEQKTKDNVIYKFSNKQGGSYNVFGYHWQCFVWAAIIGFLRNERRPLTPPIADKTFSLKTMRNNDGEKDAMALICLAIAKAGTLDIMKDPNDAINLINEYANGGFYHIMKLIENGENNFNDLEKVKQEIFSRDYTKAVDSKEEFHVHEVGSVTLEDFLLPQLDEAAAQQAAQDFEDENPYQEVTPEEKSKSFKKVRHRWTTREVDELRSYYEQGMTVDQLVAFLGRSAENITIQLQKIGLM